jgi:hypothetical protein
MKLLLNHQNTGEHYEIEADDIIDCLLKGFETLGYDYTILNEEENEARKKRGERALKIINEVLEKRRG